MNNDIQFSVVIPLYNKVNHIKRAIDSVLNQSIQNFELIVVDDGSTDGSEKIVQLYDDKRIRLISQSNSGVSAARNRGIEESRAPYISFLDADDAWQPVFLDVITKLIHQFPDSGAYTTAFQTKECDGSYFNYPKESYPAEGIIDNYFDYLSKSIYFHLSNSSCVKKELFKQAGGFDTMLRIGEDIDMWIRIFLNAKVAFSPIVCTTYYRDAENRSVELSNFNQKELELVGHLQKYMTDPRMTKAYLLSFKKFLSQKLKGAIVRYIIGNYKKEAILAIITYWKILDLKQKFYLMFRIIVPKQITDLVRR